MDEFSGFVVARALRVRVCGLWSILLVRTFMSFLICHCYTLPDLTETAKLQVPFMHKFMGGGMQPAMWIEQVLCKCCEATAGL